MGSSSRISTLKNFTSQLTLIYITGSTTRWFRCAKETPCVRKNATHSPTHPPTHPCIWHFYLLQSMQTYSGAHPVSMSIDTGAFPPGVKAVGAWYSSFTSYWYQDYEPGGNNLWVSHGAMMRCKEKPRKFIYWIRRLVAKLLAGQSGIRIPVRDKSFYPLYHVQSSSGAGGGCPLRLLVSRSEGFYPGLKAAETWSW